MVSTTQRAEFRSEFRFLEVMFPADRFGTVPTEKHVRDSLNRVVLGPDNKPLMEQAPIRSITFQEGALSLPEDDPYVSLLRRHPHNAVNGGGGGGGEFFEVKIAADHQMQTAAGVITLREPAGGLTDEDRQRLTQMDKNVHRGIGGTDGMLKQAAQMLTALIERFEVRGIHVPPPERLKSSLLRARLTELQEALDQAHVWPPTESEAHERRGDASGSQAAHA